MAEHPALAVSMDIGRAMAILLNTNLHLLSMLDRQPPISPPPVPDYNADEECPTVTLTDEDRPVRLQVGECYIDMSFPAAARLFVALGRVGQVTELVEELTHG